MSTTKRNACSTCIRGVGDSSPVRRLSRVLSMVRALCHSATIVNGQSGFTRRNLDTEWETRPVEIGGERDNNGGT